MAYQGGTTNLSSGVQDYTVTFPTAFTATPGVILPVVQNTSADAVKLLITAQVVASSATQFSVRISGAPNSNNYVLAWVAGDIATIFAAVSILGVRMSQLPVQSSAPGDNDYFPIVSTASLPVSKRLTFGVLATLFVNYVPTPPASPAAAGSIGDYATDTDYVYFHTGVQWGRIGLQLGSWDTGSAPIVQQEGTVTLVSGNAAPSFTFPVSFSGTTPAITGLIFGNTAGGTNLMLAGQVASVSLSGFSLALNAEPDNSTYTLYWQARQI